MSGPQPSNNLFSRVTQPARYMGGETGSVGTSNPRLTFALAFPEIYELAMSHLGIKILYDLMARREDVACERVFAPWTDLMALLRESGQPLSSLESGRALSRFAVVGFSLPYEMLYSNMLQMLKLSQIPLRRTERGPDHPLIIGGGPSMVNPEPVADFLDLALVGEAEDVLELLLDLLILAKSESWPRERLYLQAAQLPGIYAPALFEPVYRNGRFQGMRQPNRVKRAVVKDLNAVPLPSTHIVPSISPVHDRLSLEITRGCTRGCRFCQAGYIYRPLRERQPEKIFRAALEGVRQSGMEEISLLSLSTGDYSCIEVLSRGLMDHLSQAKVSLSLPSLRVDSLSAELAEQIKRVRKTGFTLAPEAGSERLRALINKNLSEEQIIAMAREIYALGWEHIKLYFMVGLPGEEDEDLTAIARLSARVAESARQAGQGGRGGKPLVHASMGLFVPKAHTPFQWEAQLPLEEARRRMRLAKAENRHKRVRSKWNDAQISMLEGVFSRGDRRLSQVLENAVEMGACFDGWSEHFNLELWLKAMERAGLGLDEYLRARGLDEPLPWDHIDVGVSKDFLRQERGRALELIFTPDCRGNCQQCGVCDWRELKPVTAGPAWQPAAPEPALPDEERVIYRFILQKTGVSRFFGHLELMSQLVRCFRRAGVDLAYSQGYHPHPLLKTASALPLGVESLNEELEAVLTRYWPVNQLLDALNQAMPAGLKLLSARPARPGERLQDPSQATYIISQAEGLEQAAIDAFQQAAAWPWLRQTPKGEKNIDLKQCIADLQLTSSGLKVVINLQGPRPKPAEILQSVFHLAEARAGAARVVKL